MLTINIHVVIVWLNVSVFLGEDCSVRSCRNFLIRRLERVLNSRNTKLTQLQHYFTHWPIYILDHWNNSYGRIENFYILTRISYWQLSLSRTTNFSVITFLLLRRRLFLQHFWFNVAVSHGSHCSTELCIGKTLFIFIKSYLYLLRSCAQCKYLTNDCAFLCKTSIISQSYITLTSV